MPVNYQLARTITLTSKHSGVTIEGPSNAAAILDRNNVGFNMFDLQNADNITFSHLTFQEAYDVFSAWLRPTAIP